MSVQVIVTQGDGGTVNVNNVSASSGAAPSVTIPRPNQRPNPRSTTSTSSVHVAPVRGQPSLRDTEPPPECDLAIISANGPQDEKVESVAQALTLLTSDLSQQTLPQYLRIPEVIMNQFVPLVSGKEEKSEEGKAPQPQAFTAPIRTGRGSTKWEKLWVNSIQEALEAWELREPTPWIAMGAIAIVVLIAFISARVARLLPRKLFIALIVIWLGICGIIVAAFFYLRKRPHFRVRSARIVVQPPALLRFARSAISEGGLNPETNTFTLTAQECRKRNERVVVGAGDFEEAPAAEAPNRILRPTMVYHIAPHSEPVEEAPTQAQAANTSRFGNPICRGSDFWRVMAYDSAATTFWRGARFTSNPLFAALGGTDVDSTHLTWTGSESAFTPRQLGETIPPKGKFQVLGCLVHGEVKEGAHGVPGAPNCFCTLGAAHREMRVWKRTNEHQEKSSGADMWRFDQPNLVLPLVEFTLERR